MADIENGIVETKNLHKIICAACCKWAALALHVADGWWHFVSLLLRCGDQQSVYNGSCGANPPPANVGGRVLFGV